MMNKFDVSFNYLCITLFFLAISFDSFGQRSHYKKQVRHKSQIASSNCIHNPRLIACNLCFNKVNRRQEIHSDNDCSKCNNIGCSQRSTCRTERRDVLRVNQFSQNDRIDYLPQNTITFYGPHRNYHFVRGKYYVETTHGYQIQQIPIGARIESVPNRARTIRDGRITYHQLGNAYFEARVDRFGNTFYEVIGYE